MTRLQVIARAAAAPLGAMLAIGVVACGSGATARAPSDPAGLPADAVARVGAVTITRATLAHEMATIFGGDYFEITQRVEPGGLVAEPANPRACSAELRRLVVARIAPGGSLAISQRARLCAQLHEAIKRQALEALLADQWSIGVDGEQGVHVDDAQVKRALERIVAREFRTQAAFRAYLTEHRWSIVDEQLLVRMDLLAAAVGRRIAAPGGGRVQAALVRAAASWTARTSCAPGYVVARCRQFRAGAQGSAPPPAALIERIASPPRAAEDPGDS
jgi:hypothetical protein